MSKVPTALNIIGESNRVIAHTGLRNNPILGYFLSFFTSFGSMTHVIVLSLSIFFIAPPLRPQTMFMQKKIKNATLHRPLSRGRGAAADRGVAAPLTIRTGSSEPCSSLSLQPQLHATSLYVITSALPCASRQSGWVERNTYAFLWGERAQLLV